MKETTTTRRTRTIDHAELVAAGLVAADETLIAAAVDLSQDPAGQLVLITSEPEPGGDG